MRKRISLKIIFIIILALLTLALFCFWGGGKKITPPIKAEQNNEALSFKLATAHAGFEERDSQSVFVFQDKIWLIGGLNANDALYNKRGIDLIADWTRYVFQGKKISAADYFVNYNKAKYFKDIWSSADGINWTKEGEAPWPASRSVSIIKFQDQLFAINGFSLAEGEKNSIWTSLDGVNWKQQKSGPWEAREGQQVLIFRGKLWMFGGVNYEENKTFQDIWSSADGINWTKEGEAPWPSRWDQAMAVFNNKIFLTGGMDLKGNVFNDEWVTIDGINWELVKNINWGARQGHSLLTANNQLWLLGKLTNPNSLNENDVWFSADGLRWEKFNEKIPWQGREDFGSVVFKNKIWIFAGMDSDYRWRNDVWYLGWD